MIEDRDGENQSIIDATSMDLNKLSIQNDNQLATTSSTVSSASSSIKSNSSPSMSLKMTIIQLNQYDTHDNNQLNKSIINVRIKQKCHKSILRNIERISKLYGVNYVGTHNGNIDDSILCNNTLNVIGSTNNTGTRLPSPDEQMTFMYFQLFNASDDNEIMFLNTSLQVSNAFKQI